MYHLEVTRLDSVMDLLVTGRYLLLITTDIVIVTDFIPATLSSHLALHLGTLNTLLLDLLPSAILVICLPRRLIRINAPAIMSLVLPPIMPKNLEKSSRYALKISH